MGEFLLSTVLPFFLLFLLILIIVLLFWCTVSIVKFLKKIPKVHLTILVLALIIGAYIRFIIVPSEQRVLFDEDRYLSYAVSFAKFGKTVSIDLATPEKHILGKPDQAVRSTTPVINGTVLYLTDFNEEYLFLFAKLISILSILLLFVLCVLVFQRYTVASISALLLAVFPVSAYWAPSTGLDSYFYFFALLTMVCASAYARSPQLKSLLLLSSSMFLLLCVRVEAVVFLPLVFGVIGVIRKSENKGLLIKYDIKMLSVVTPLILFRIFISLSVLGQKWCCAEALPLESFATTYTIRHLLLNVMDLFIRPEVPFILTILMAVSIVNAFTQKNLKMILFTVWFFLFFFLYSSYYAGRFFTYEFSGSYGRFFLMLMPPFIILSALSIEALIFYFLKHNNKKKFWILLLFISMILLSYQTIINYHKLITRSPYYDIVEKGPQDLRRFLISEMLQNTEPNSVIIHNLTALLLLHDHESIFFGSFLNDPQVAKFIVNALKSGQPVYSVEAPQCVIFPQRCEVPAKYLIFEHINPEATMSGKLEYVKVRLKTASESGKMLYLTP